MDLQCFFYPFTKILQWVFKIHLTFRNVKWWKWWNGEKMVEWEWKWWNVKCDSWNGKSSISVLFFSSIFPFKNPFECVQIPILKWVISHFKNCAFCWWFCGNGWFPIATSHLAFTILNVKWEEIYPLRQNTSIFEMGNHTF